jgi:limonene 1,2-monooxygenase
MAGSTHEDSPDRPLRSGIFLAPFHPIREDPTLAIQRDLELIRFLDELGYEEAWVGEHHSAGFEIIASPEVFIAAAAERSRRIRLGTGVVSLPYHHPLTVANRIIQLDHQTRGRVMFGIGPGLLPSDAGMLGIEVSTQRDRMNEALEVILRLFRGETVDHESDWFTLRGATCQLRPFTRPHPEIAVASTVTPNSAVLAGTHGLGMLCVAATTINGYDVLGTNWQIANDTAARSDRVMDRGRLRLVGPMHLAETRERAMDNVRFGLADWIGYFRAVNPASPPELSADDPVAAMVESGMAVIGTPDDAVAQLDRLWQRTGGFGCFLQLAHNWANWENTRASYEMFARYVTPVFAASNRARELSLERYRSQNQELIGKALAATMDAISKNSKEIEQAIANRSSLGK